MKSFRTAFVLLMLAAVLVLLIWMFWPRQATKTVASAPKATSLPTAATPKFAFKPARVEAPKAAPAPAGQKPESMPTPAPVSELRVSNDFGEVEMTVGQPMLLPLKSGKFLGFTPKLLPDGNLLLDINLEQRTYDPGLDQVTTTGQGLRFVEAPGESINFPLPDESGFSMTPKWKSIDPSPTR
jgi:hypothetical protein